jgi:hypothetical protein
MTIQVDDESEYKDLCKGLGEMGVGLTQCVQWEDPWGAPEDWHYESVYRSDPYDEAETLRRHGKNREECIESAKAEAEEKGVPFLTKLPSIEHY